METLFSPIRSSKTCQFFHSSPFTIFPRNNRKFTQSSSSTTTTVRTHHISARITSTNFLDLKPETKPEFLDFDLPLFNPSGDHHRNWSHPDVIVIGAGPAGLRLAEQLASSGVHVLSVDPSPLAPWKNNYAVWADEFASLDLDHCFDRTWPVASIFLDDARAQHLDRPYARVCRKKLKMELMQRCISNGVKFHAAKVSKIEHRELESTVICDDGKAVKASLVVDASGVSSPFVEYDKPRTSHGFQIAHGILAEVESHPFDLDKMVFMDWRDSHLGNEPELRSNNMKTPTFLYAMPFESNLIFLEETSLVCRPALSFAEVQQRMAARLRHLGIKVKRVFEDEKCFTSIGGPLPRMAQSVMAIGGSSGEIQPATGFMLAKTMALTPVVASAIVECLGSARMVRGKPLYGKVWNSLWPSERRREREGYSFGMETLLRLDLDGVRRIFNTFFDLDPEFYHGFLSSTLTLQELGVFAFAVFVRASPPTKLDIVTKCPPLLVRMMQNIALDTIS